MKPKVSIILPAKDEAQALEWLLPDLKEAQPESEIIVVDDGSKDATADVCRVNQVTVISHPYAMGNGAAIKTGARAASGDILVFMDADGQHRAEDIEKFLPLLDQGYDMVVGARHWSSQAGKLRWIGNRLYNRLGSWMVGHRILDLTSGFRAVRARQFRKFLYLLPNGFSYPSTSTLAFFRSAFPVAYVPIHAEARIGRSKLRLAEDGLRFFIIIVKIGALFSPMRLFLPISAALFLIGLGYYAYTFATMGRFTNMTAVLFLAALFTFLIGILSEQVSALHYRQSHEDQ